MQKNCIKKPQEHPSAKKRFGTLRVILFTMFCLALLSTVVTSFTVSYYATNVQGTAGTDVAVFDAAYSSGEQSIAVSLAGIKPGDTKTVTLRVENSGDVSISYSLSADTAANLPLVVSLSSDTGTLLLTDDAAEHTLSVYWPADQNNAALAEELDALTVTLRYDQLD